MSARDALSPAFVEATFHEMVGPRLPAKLAEVQANYTERFGQDIPLPVPSIRRTKPDFWPEADQTLILYGETNAFVPQQNEQGLLQGLDIVPGQGAEYSTALRVEAYYRGGTSIGPLREEEVLNIQCKNTVWAAYLVVIDIAYETEFSIEFEGMGFANQRGEDFPLTEYGQFRFIAYVR